MRGVPSLERRLLVEGVRLVEGRAAVALAAPARQRYVLGGEVVLGLGPGQRQPLEGPAQLGQVAVAGVQPRHRLLGEVHVVRLGRERVHDGVDGLALAAEVLLAVRHQVRVLADLVQPRAHGVRARTLGGAGAVLNPSDSPVCFGRDKLSVSRIDGSLRIHLGVGLNALICCKSNRNRQILKSSLFNHVRGKFYNYNKLSEQDRVSNNVSPLILLILANLKKALYKLFSIFSYVQSFFRVNLIIHHRY